MRYDIRLSITYRYYGAADSGRHLLRMAPMNLAGEQS
ncbi:transglutaminase family protein, partial [Bradyrhizobium sp. NBAIM08]|nr:transglutaminase family protein [Bradyrhizobium sp. NBAIM08]